MKQFMRILMASILLVFALSSCANSRDDILTLRLVHPDNDKLMFLPQSEADVDNELYEYFEKGSEHYWVSRNVKVDMADMKAAKLRVITPPSKEEIEEISKSRPNTSISLEPTYNLTISLTEEGSAKLRKLTRENVKRRLAIIYEGRLLVAPVIKEEITGDEVEVSGLSGYDEAVRLRDAINNR